MQVVVKVCCCIHQNCNYYHHSSNTPGDINFLHSISVQSQEHQLSHGLRKDYKRCEEVYSTD